MSFAKLYASGPKFDVVTSIPFVAPEMVYASKIGQPYIVNLPSDGWERYDGAALGVYAKPLPAVSAGH